MTSGLTSFTRAPRFNPRVKKKCVPEFLSSEILRAAQCLEVLETKMRSLSYIIYLSDEWKRMKETNSVPAWEEEAKPDEVLVQTSTGLFKFQGRVTKGVNVI